MVNQEKEKIRGSIQNIAEYMFDSNVIIEREINKSHHREQEYWGPIDHHFSDAFLNMTYKMLSDYFSLAEKKLYKTIFSAVTELVQNVADYNAKTFVDSDFPASFYSLVLNEHTAQIKCFNQVLSKDSERIGKRLSFLESMNNQELNEEFKQALLNGKSLGLVMLHRFQDVKIEWKIQKSKKNLEWFNIYVTLNYASFRN